VAFDILPDSPRPRAVRLQVLSEPPPLPAQQRQPLACGDSAAVSQFLDLVKSEKLGEVLLGPGIFTRTVEPAMRIIRRDVHSYLPHLPALVQWLRVLVSCRVKGMYLTPRQRQTIRTDVDLLHTLMGPGPSPSPCSTLLPPREQQILDSRTDRVILVLDGVRDVGNVASIYRICDALGVQQVWRVLPLHMKTFRLRYDATGLSRGCESYLTKRTYRTGEECLQELRAQGREVWVTDLGEGAVEMSTKTMLAGGGRDLPDIALVVGEESRGVSEVFRSTADKRVYLPMRGFVQSHNVAVASALCLQLLLPFLECEGGIADPALRDTVAREWATLL
jgi:tRNA (guanosine-2'-O-)-methyltransferase